HQGTDSPEKPDLTQSPVSQDYRRGHQRTDSPEKPDQPERGRREGDGRRGHGTPEGAAEVQGHEDEKLCRQFHQDPVMPNLERERRGWYPHAVAHAPGSPGTLDILTPASETIFIPPQRPLLACKLFPPCEYLRCCRSASLRFCPLPCVPRSPRASRS